MEVARKEKLLDPPSASSKGVEVFDDRDMWRLLVQVHNYAKGFLLKAEEIDPKHQFYFPPLIQQRDELDHIMRAAFAIVFEDEYKRDLAEDSKLSPAKYAGRQLDKALGHAYRALFDAGDWLGIIYRERIRELMAAYSAETVVAVFPSFRTEIEPRVEQIGLETAALRSTKDIGNKKGLIKGADAYLDLVNELERYWLAVLESRPELDLQEFGQEQCAGQSGR